jgi:membrane protein required for colicin V production
MNSFDAIVCVGLAFAVVTGFNTGLVRGAVTILAYLVAAPIAMWVISALSPPASGNLASVLAQNGFAFFGIFLFAGTALGKLARIAVDEATGTQAGIVDRLCGGYRRCGRRPATAAATSAALADRLAIAAMALGGGTKRRQIAAAGGRRYPRSAEANPADIIALLICISTGAQALIRDA